MINCPICGFSDNDYSAHYCVKCGAPLNTSEKWELCNTAIDYIVPSGEHFLLSLEANLYKETNRKLTSAQENINVLVNERDNLNRRVAQLNTELIEARTQISSLQRERDTLKRTLNHPTTKTENHNGSLWNRLKREWKEVKYIIIFVVFEFALILLIFIGLFKACNSL